MKKLAVVSVVFLALLAGCGDEPGTDSDPTVPYEDTGKVSDRVDSYIVKADGKEYRCFDTGYKGGIWCTERTENDLD